MDTKDQFCSLIRRRTSENREAMELLSRARLFGQMMSIVRQELDSLVRCIYLLETDVEQRNILMSQTLNGNRWRNENNRIITDRDMVDISNNLWGWTESVYKLGCSFIHLSNFHGYLNNNPFDVLDDIEKEEIKYHLNNYHGFNTSNELSFTTISPFLKPVFDKVSSNLDCYVERLENNELKAD